MNDFSELQTALLSDLNVSYSSSLYPPATIKLALNRAYIKCARLFRWPQLMDAKKTSTQSNIEYYDAPEDWSPNSIWRLEVDDKQYGEDPDGSPMAYEDYLQWRRDEDNDNSTDKKWSVQYLRYFFYPVPTTAGSYNISVWGQKNVNNLDGDTDETIFSHNMPECNEAIVLEAREILKLKGEDQKAVGNDQMLSPKALGILTVSFSKLKQESAKYEKVQPFFNVPDYFGKGNTTDRIGQF